MKAKQVLIVFLILLYGMRGAFGQGTFQYDQQSSMEGNSSDGAIPSINSYQVLGQSFMPSLNAVGFVRLALYDSSLNNNREASLEIVIRSDSISGPIIGTSQTVNLPAGFGGYPDFIFSTPVSVSPGTTYYWQPILLSGDEGIEQARPFQYANGIEYLQGVARSSDDFWFREGIIVPEPSTWALMILGGGACLLFRRRC